MQSVDPIAQVPLIGRLSLWHLEVWHKRFYEMLNQSIS